MWIVKAYLQKEGTTTIQCARRLKRTCSVRRWHSELRLFHRQSEDVICSSDDCFGRQHSLLQPDHWAEKTASHQWAIETVNKSMGYRQDYQESPPIRMEQEYVCWLPADTVPIYDCDSVCTESADLFPLSVSAEWGRLLHSDNHRHPKGDFILRSQSLSWPDHSPVQANRIRCLLPAIPRLAKAYHQKRRQHRMKCARRLKRTCSSRRWHSSFHVIPPDSPKMWPARQVTASGGNTRFRNKSFGLFVYVIDN